MKKITAQKAAEMMAEAGLHVTIKKSFAGDHRARTVIGRLVRPAKTGSGRNISMYWVQYTTWHGTFDFAGPGWNGDTMPSLDAAIDRLRNSPQDNDYYSAEDVG